MPHDDFLRVPATLGWSSDNVSLMTMICLPETGVTVLLHRYVVDVDCANRDSST